MPPINTKNAVTTFNSIAASTTVATLAAENGRRVGLLIHNAAATSLYVLIDGDATTSNFTFIIAAGGFYEMPYEYFTDKVTGILGSGTGDVKVTEISDN